MSLPFELYKKTLIASGLVTDQQIDRTVRQMLERSPGAAVDTETLSRKLLEAGIITPWQNSKLLKGCTRGFFIGRYRLLAHLGTGGMSRVYRGVHTMMKRSVAIKVLNQKLTESPSHLERFMRESQAAAALDHINVVRAFDVDCEQGLYYFVMEFVDGPTLQQLVEARGPMDYVTAADYVRQSCSGLHHAHEAALVHRDIKPGNLLVNPKGIVKLLDLGMVRLSGDEIRSITIQFNESMLGTADYLAPEQALDSHNVDRRADIYSMGCTFYFMLTGHPPFDDGSMAMRLMRHQSEEPPKIRNVRPDCPQEILDIVAKMMAKNRDDRFQTAAEVGQALTNWLEQHLGSDAARGVLSEPPRSSADDDTVTASNPTTTVEAPVANPAAAALAASMPPRPADASTWKYRDYELALLEGDPAFGAGVNALVKKFAGNEKVTAFLNRLINSSVLTKRRAPRRTLAALLKALSETKDPTTTKTLMRLVVGAVPLGPNDPDACAAAIDILAGLGTAESEQFLVQVICNAEEARPAGRSQVSPKELRQMAANALQSHMNPTLRSVLEVRLTYRSLGPAAREAIETILAKTPAGV